LSLIFQGDDHIIFFYFDAIADVEIGIISLLILALVTHFQGDDHIIFFYFDAIADVEIGIISFHVLSRDAQAVLPQVVHS
jgi:hypothetical protein